MTESPDERDRRRLPRPRGAPDDATGAVGASAADDGHAVHPRDATDAVPDGPWSEWIPAPRSPVGERVPRSGTPSGTAPSAALLVAPVRLPMRRPVPAAQRWRRAADVLARAALLVAGAVADTVLAVGSLVARLLSARPATTGA